MVAVTLVSCLSLGSTQAEDVMLPTNVPNFPALIATHGDVLADVMSDKGAVNFFVTTLGPALHLNEVANTLGAKNIPAKLSKELFVEELTTAAVRLVGALAAWRAASGTQQPLRDGQATGTVERVPAAPLQRDWLAQHGMSLTEIESLQAAYRQWDRLRYRKK